MLARLMSGLGAESGWAEFALKKPPPFVPRCLMTSWLAFGPPGIVCVTCDPPATVSTTWSGVRFSMTPKPM